MRRCVAGRVTALWTRRRRSTTRTHPSRVQSPGLPGGAAGGIIVQSLPNPVRKIFLFPSRRQPPPRQFKPARPNLEPVLTWWVRRGRHVGTLPRRGYAVNPFVGTPRGYGGYTPHPYPVIGKSGVEEECEPQSPSRSTLFSSSGVRVFRGGALRKSYRKCLADLL